MGEEEGNVADSSSSLSTTSEWTKYRWAALVALLAVLTVGFSTVFSLFAVLLCFILGVVVVLIKHGRRRSEDLLLEFNNFDAEFSCGIKSFLGSVERQERSYLSEKLTGSATLDPIIEEIVGFALRDFVDSWFGTLSNDESFRESLRQTAYRAVNVLTAKMRGVDWTPLLTRHIVDDFASHIRIYRKARDKLRIEQINAQRLRRDPSIDPSRQPEPVSEDGALESIFFDLELDMEKTYCRDLVSTSSQYENAYLHDVADILLYLIIPPEDFRCRPERFLLRECLVKRILLPVLELFSDPDYLNQTIVWLLMDVPMDTTDFLQILATSKHAEELRCTKEAILQQISIQRSKDTGGQNDAFVKQQLGSLSFVLSMVDRRLKELMGHSVDTLATAMASAEQPASLGDLPLSFVLTKGLTLAYFIDFLQSQDAGHLIDLYLAIEGFKLSAEHQLADAHLNLVTKRAAIDPDILDNIREAAAAVFHQYLAVDAPYRVRMDEQLVKAVEYRIAHEKPSDCWFDPVQQKITEILDKDVRYFPAFKMHPQYFRMLSELAVADQMQSPLQSDCSLSEAIDLSLEDDEESVLNNLMQHQLPQSDSEQLTANIANIGIGREGNRAFALYNIRVSRQDSLTGEDKAKWSIMRRYSDFHQLNALVESRYPNLANLRFPGKKTFNNLNQDFLEKRKRALNNYLAALLNKDVMASNSGLDHIVIDFVCSKHFTGDQKAIGKRVMNTFVNPIKSGVRAFGDAVISVPEMAYGGVVKGVEGVGKVTKSIISGPALDELSQLNAQSSPIEGRVGAGLDDQQYEDTIPLRIMLLFMDDVFGLRGRNQWFRRSMTAFARQFVHAALGSSINRKIIEFFAWLTSEEQVAGYLRAFRDSFWPNGVLAESNPERPAHIQMRARVVTKTKLLSMLPEQLRLFVGNETSREGIELVFNALQHTHLNRRLCYVLLERLLVTVFPENRFDKLLPRLHSKSPRCQQPV